MNFLVTGAAGFVGSNLVDRLISQGHSVTGVDNLSTGHVRFLEDAFRSPRFRLERLDLLHDSLASLLSGVDFLFHLAANADVRFGPDHPTRDLEQNTIVTARVLEAARKAGVGRIGFASTGSVYGEATVIPTPEDAPFPLQTSLYGASKSAAEGMICAYAEAFGIQAYIFRFVSILGERYTHGHVLDFYKQLREHPEKLTILGDGTQRKSYLYVQDCVGAITHAIEQAQARINLFNLGTDEYCRVNDSVQWICENLGLNPALAYTGGERGWIGDNRFIFLDCSRIRALGWKPQLTIRQSVIRTVEFLQRNAWVLGEVANEPAVVAAGNGYRARG
jgi:UDP-glucose 4-epimerase